MTQLTKDDQPKPTGLALTEPRKKKFLELLITNGNISRSAAELGLSYATIKSHASKDLYFKEAVDIAQAKYLGALEDAARKRAVEGVEKGVWFQGQQVGTETVYSDRLLETMLKAADPDKYATKTSQTNNVLLVDGDGSVVNKLFDLFQISENASEKDSEESIVEGEYEDTSGEE